MSETGYVYTLSDPRTGRPKYVGATKNPKNRFNQHTNNPHNEELEEWIKELQDKGEMPTMSLVRVSDVDRLSELEQEVLATISEEFEVLNVNMDPGYTPNLGSEKDSDRGELKHTVKLSKQAKEGLEEFKTGNGHTSFDSAVRELLDEVKE